MAPALDAHTAPTNAVLYVRILKDMRAERYSRAMDVLEALLDGAIIDHALTRSYGIFPDSAELMEEVATYRDAHPPQVKEVAEIVHRALSRYKPGNVAAPLTSPVHDGDHTGRTATLP